MFWGSLSAPTGGSRGRSPLAMLTSAIAPSAAAWTLAEMTCGGSVTEEIRRFFPDVCHSTLGLTAEAKTNGHVLLGPGIRYDQCATIRKFELWKDQEVSAMGLQEADRVEVFERLRGDEWLAYQS